MLIVSTYNILVIVQTSVIITVDYAATIVRPEADPGVAIGAIASPKKPTKVTFFTMIVYNLDNSIRDTRPFCLTLFAWPPNIAEIPPRSYWLDPPLSLTQSGKPHGIKKLFKQAEQICAG